MKERQKHSPPNVTSVWALAIKHSIVKRASLALFNKLLREQKNHKFPPLLYSPIDVSMLFLILYLFILTGKNSSNILISSSILQYTIKFKNKSAYRVSDIITFIDSQLPVLHL